MKLRTFILLSILYAWFGKDGKAQSSQPVSTPQPTCILTAQFTAVGVSRVLDNRAVGCLNFTLTVDVPITVSALSLQVQVSQGDGSLNCATCTWAVLTPATGSNPNTLTTGWNATFTTGLTIYYNWFQIALTAETGTIAINDPITAKLYGTINGGGGGGGGGGSGCAGTAGTPCVVDGPNASGTPPTFPPVLFAGQTGSDAGPGNVETVHVDTLGNLQVDQIGNATLITNQQAVTAAAVALPSNAIKNVCVKALVGNLINVYMGATGVTITTGMELAPGDAFCQPLANTNLIFVVASTTGASVSWSATE